MKEEAAVSDRLARAAREEERLAKAVRRTALVTLTAFACLWMTSCLGDRYVRDWTYNGDDLSDTLLLTESSFSLERVSADGVEVFSGRFTSGRGLWRFEIETWKPARGKKHHFDPPAVFVCRGRLFENGVAFFSGRFLGEVPIVLFIRTPTDFDRQD
jgi:hypothetical protein